MVQLIYGPKGSGKTKRLISMANAELEATTGDVVFVDDDKRYMYDVKRQVRFVDVTEYNVNNEERLFGFICGILSQNFDITAIYIDAFMHMIGKKPCEIEELFCNLKDIADKREIKLVINISGKTEETPDFLKDYII